ncbi:hypothetical protein V6N11_001494 [Hibiscus sabdariffa]|uniref:Transmembrane protein n=1 Tax=Hibiscus sabdariffa TaxID=183260 RepID=A0ABR2RZX7_9ROSI
MIPPSLVPSSQTSLKSYSFVVSTVWISPSRGSVIFLGFDLDRSDGCHREAEEWKSDFKGCNHFSIGFGLKNGSRWWRATKKWRDLTLNHAMTLSLFLVSMFGFLRNP